MNDGNDGNSRSSILASAIDAGFDIVSEPLIPAYIINLVTLSISSISGEFLVLARKVQQSSAMQLLMICPASLVLS